MSGNGEKVGVKPLEWEEILVARGDGSNDVFGWEANSGFNIHYLVEIRADCFRADFDYETLGQFEDPDEAKACAQNHYECRIRAALQREEG